MKFIVYRDNKGDFRWRLRANNGQIIADSGEGYTRKDKCLTAIKRLKSKKLDLALVVELDNTNWINT